MKNDYQLLDLVGLARNYQHIYKELYDQEVQQAHAIGKKAWDKKLANTIKKLSLEMAGSEAGSDGIEESAIELIGPYNGPTVEIDTNSIKDSAREMSVRVFLDQNNINQKLSWFGIQLLAYFGSWTPVKVGDKYCPEATLESNVVAKKDLFALGSILLAKTSRAEFFKDAPKGNQQYKNSINPLVPIVLGGQKKYNGINYMEWDLSKVGRLENTDISNLVGVKAPNLSEAEILELRNKALTPLTGPRAGKSNNPATAATLFHLNESSIGHLPRLARYIVLQTWAAHPTNRDKYAILDLENWDNVPEAIAGRDIFSPTKAISKGVYDELPWLC